MSEEYVLHRAGAWWAALIVAVKTLAAIGLLVD